MVPVSAPTAVSRLCLYFRHSPRTRSRLPKRSTMGFSKPVRNMRMKRMEVKSLMLPTLSLHSASGMRNWYQRTVMESPLRSFGV